MTCLKTILDEIDDYLDQRADSEDGSYGVPEANEAMRLRDALRAARGDGWQPIETAPKDTRILVKDDEGIYAAMYDSTHGHWAAYCGQPVVYQPEPEWWMPLPAAGAHGTERHAPGCLAAPDALKGDENG